MKVLILDNVEDFILSLDNKANKKMDKIIEYISQSNGVLREPYCKKIAQNLYEMRCIDGRQNKVRIFYTFQNNSVIFLHGFIKKTHKIPRKELEIAKRRRAEFEY